MKKIITFLLVVTVALSGCTTSTEKNKISEELEVENLNFKGVNDPALTSYIEETLYTNIINELDSDEYFIENVEATFVSKEYLEEMKYNSQSNIYFGYSLEQINDAFGDTKYIFDIDENGNTIVKELDEITDDFDKVIQNVMVGSGIILICVTVSMVTAPTVPAVSLIFATSAKSATTFALSGAVLDGVVSAAVTGYETGNMKQAMQTGIVSASEGFKWGALLGAVTGGLNSTISLKGATRNGLTMNQAAKIQRESKYPLDVIKQFSTPEQYEICKNAGLIPKMINGKTTLIRNIDLKYVDEFGRTNLERMKLGLAALDSSGQAYELHHIGQKVDSTLAILTKAEHMQGGNNTIWHSIENVSGVHLPGNNWDGQRKEVWKAVAELIEKGGI